MRTSRRRASGGDRAEALKHFSEIRFYRSNEKPYGAFSNLYRCAVQFEGRTFPTAEHAYQAGKPRKDNVREWILSAPTPAHLAMAAHGLYSWDVVENWAQIKFTRMREVLRAKFSQHDDLRLLLLSTGTAKLIEAGTVDNLVNRTWGEVNGKGQNKLGQLLMEIRTALAEQSSAPVLNGAKLPGLQPIRRKAVRVRPPRDR